MAPHLITFSGSFLPSSAPIPTTIGSSIGTAVVAAVITSLSTARGLPTDTAITAGFWVCAGVAVLAVAASLALPSARHRREAALAAGIDDLPLEPVELHVPHVPHPHPHLSGHHHAEAGRPQG